MPLFQKSTREMVTSGRSAGEDPAAETMVHGAEAALTEEAVSKGGDPGKKGAWLPGWLFPALGGALMGALLTGIVLSPARNDEPVTPTVPEGQAIVAVKADAMMTGEVVSGDVVRLYDGNGVQIDALQYVQVYGTEEQGLLLLMDEEQVEVMVGLKQTPKVVLVSHNDSGRAAELLGLQSRINNPRVSLQLQEAFVMAPAEEHCVEYEMVLDPADGIAPEIQWSSSDPEVASVGQNGKVTAHSVGQATITAACGETSAACTVTVEIPLESIELNRTEATIFVGDTVEVTATAVPENATHYNVKWSVSDPAVAMIGDDGTVTGVAPGKTTITATSGDISASCEVTVGAHAEKVELDKTSLTLRFGESAKLTPTVYPAGAMDSGTWETSNSVVAAVFSDGTVEAVFEGTAILTYRCGDAAATCTVEVLPLA